MWTISCVLAVVAFGCVLAEMAFGKPLLRVAVFFLAVWALLQCLPVK